MFVRVWRFRAAPGREREFREVYGPAGAWARLFARAPGYRGTELRAAGEGPADYLTVDRWASRDDWDAFLRAHADDYARLDRECAALTVAEEMLREGEEGAHR